MENLIDTISINNHNYKIKAKYDGEKNEITKTYDTIENVDKVVNVLKEIVEGEY